MKKHYQGITSYREKESFDKNFSALKNFLATFHHFPEKHEHPKLYSWVLTLIAEHNKKILAPKYIDQLNSIGFIWSKRDFNWFQKAEIIKEMITKNKRIPSYNKETPLYQWLNTNLDLFYKNKLSEHQKLKIHEINELIKKLNNLPLNDAVNKISSKEIKWNNKYNELLSFRKNYPKKWPSSEAKEPSEKKLGIWCQDLRSRYKKNLLDPHWLSRLEMIGFNFEGRLDNWKERFLELKEYLNIKKECPPTESKIYKWAKNQLYGFEKLTPENQGLLRSIHFFDFFKDTSWENRYQEVQKFMLFYKKTPTKKSNQELNNWLSVQRIKYKKGELSEKHIQLLTKIGIDLAPATKREDIWNNKYLALIKFREEHPNQWPKYMSEGIEKKLYLWCQAQRQVYVKTARNRKDLSKERIEKLNKIGFHWSIDEVYDKKWEVNFQKIEAFIKNHKTTLMPVKLNGRNNELYHWLRNQKKAFAENKLSPDKIKRLHELGIVLKS